MRGDNVAAAIAALIAAGYEQDGETRTEEVRMPTGQFSIVGHGKIGGKLTRFGGRLRFRRGDEFATVGARTTCFYRLSPAGDTSKREPTGFENIPTRDTARIAERVAQPAPEQPAPKFRQWSQRFDHHYEPGAYGVCRRCGGERHGGPS